MNYSTLFDMITFLEYGTKLHIGVLFFGNYGNEKFTLPIENTIHAGVICDEFKSHDRGLERCFRCRNIAIQKALCEKKAFGGLCINGVYEYTKPVVVDDVVVCIIYIGNILPCIEEREKILNKLTKKVHLIETLEKDFGFEKCEAVGALIESYIKMIITIEPEKAKNNSFDPMIENLKNYISSNLEYKINITQLARIFHYNEKYLGRIFKKKTGFKLSEYINMRRIQYSKKLIENSDDTIINISIKSGFQSVTYFNKIFKKYFNMTPTEYRKNNCKF